MQYNPGKKDSFVPKPEWFKRGSDPAFRFVIIRDTREQLGWTWPGFPGFEMIDKALPTGDYTIGFKFERQTRIMDRTFVVERKGSASEMVSMVGQDRERWQEELSRIKRIRHPFIICEFTLEDFMQEAATSGVNMASAFGSIWSWQKYCPVIFAGNRTYAQEGFLVLARMIFKTYVLCHRKGSRKEASRGLDDIF